VEARRRWDPAPESPVLMPVGTSVLAAVAAEAAAAHLGSPLAGAATTIVASTQPPAAASPSPSAAPTATSPATALSPLAAASPAVACTPPVESPAPCTLAGALDTAVPATATFVSGAADTVKPAGVSCIPEEGEQANEPADVNPSNTVPAVPAVETEAGAAEANAAEGDQAQQEEQEEEEDLEYATMLGTMCCVLNSEPAQGTSLLLLYNLIVALTLSFFLG
jgi:hypothetical protein